MAPDFKSFQNRRFTGFLRYWLAVISLTVGLTSAAAAKAPPSDFNYVTPMSSLPARVLVFPNNFSLGGLQACVNPYSGTKADTHCEAKGRIYIPAKRFVRFVPAHHFFANPSALDAFAPDSIQSLTLSASSLDDAEDGWCDRAIGRLAHLTGVVEVTLDRSDATDNGVKYLGNYANLEKLTAFMAPIEGKSLRQMSACKKLSCIILPQCPIVDENLRFLSDIKSLKFLDLAKTGISDKGVKYLGQCHKLEMLDVSSCRKITDASIPEIFKIKSLRDLSVEGTSISLAGLLKLKGLALVRLVLPSKTVPESILKTIRAAFPGAYIAILSKKISVDDDTKAIYAPLH